jgi:hypothetical protein
MSGVGSKNRANACDGPCVCVCVCVCVWGGSKNRTNSRDAINGLRRFSPRQFPQNNGKTIEEVLSRKKCSKQRLKIIDFKDRP